MLLPKFPGKAPDPIDLRILLASDHRGDSTDGLSVETFPGVVANVGQPHSVREGGFVETLIPVTLQVDEHRSLAAGEALKGTITWRHEGARLDTEVILQRESIIVAIPPTVFVNSIGAEPGSQTLQLQSHVPFHILRLRTSNDRISVKPLQSDFLNRHSFEVSVAGHVESAETPRYQIVFETDLDEQPSITVDIWVLE